MTLFRLLLIAAAAIAFAFDLVVLNAASVTEHGLELLAQPMPTPLARTVQAQLAAAAIDDAWSRPTLWHGGAAEARAWAAARLADAATDPKARGERQKEAVDLSRAAIRMSPVTPTAWVRLQALDRDGAPGARCTPLSCVAESYRAAPMTRRVDMECSRFHLSGAADQVNETDPRLIALLGSGMGGSELAACLQGLPPETTYRLLRLSHRLQ